MDLIWKIDWERKPLSFQDVLNRPAEEFGNDESVETMWAMKAFEHAEIYFNVRFTHFHEKLSLSNTHYKHFTFSCYAVSIQNC